MNDSHFTRSSSKTRTSKIAASIALALALGILPLAACSGQQAASSPSAGASSQASESVEPNASAATIDTSSWKTLGDALDNATSNPNAGWDDEYYLCDFEIGESTIHAVAKMAPGVGEKIAELDFDDKDYNTKLRQAVGGLELISAEDISSYKLDRTAMDALVGKTGQELFDEGFVFEGYFMYGGDNTGATLAKDYFSYGVTFDASVPENNTEEDGASIKNAKVVEVDFQGTSTASLDPATIK